MFLIFLYFFSSALVLYWTVQNLMTILQTLITKSKTETPSNTATVIETNEDTNKSIENKREISEKEKRYRNLLGLKSRGLINVALLKSNFEERAKNYSDSKLEGMNSAKRRLALEKKDRLDRAYEYLMDQASK
jgi:hypothetical protein